MEEIKRQREYELRLTEYINELKVRNGDAGAEEFAELRKIPLEEVKSSGIFRINSMAEMVLPKYINELSDFGIISPSNNKPIFSSRWLIPIKNEEGLVRNVVGYSNTADERYVYGTAKYYSRTDTLYGLENLKYAYELGYAILTEGITDTIRVRSLGYRNSFAACGSRESLFKMKQLNRCKHGIIRIPHRDTAGLKTREHWITNRFITLNIPANMNDLDDTVRDSEDGETWVKQYLDICIKWLKSGEHRGNICPKEEITMM